MLVSKRRSNPILFKDPFDKHVEKFEGRDEDKWRTCVEKTRPPIADDDVAARVRKELSLRLVYWVDYCVRPGWKQLLLHECVDSLEEPRFIFRAFGEFDERTRSKGWVRGHDLCQAFRANVMPLSGRGGARATLDTK